MADSQLVATIKIVQNWSYTRFYKRWHTCQLGLDNSTALAVRLSIVLTAKLVLGQWRNQVHFTGGATRGQALFKGGGGGGATV